MNWWKNSTDKGRRLKGFTWRKYLQVQVCICSVLTLIPKIASIDSKEITMVLKPKIGAQKRRISQLWCHLVHQWCSTGQYKVIAERISYHDNQQMSSTVAACGLPMFILLMKCILNAEFNSKSIQSDLRSQLNYCNVVSKLDSWYRVVEWRRPDVWVHILKISTWVPIL